VAARIGSAYRSLADQEHAEKDATIAELRAEVEEYRAKKFAPMSRIQRAERVAENAVADKRAAEARVAEKDATIADVLAKRNEDDVERWSGVLSEAEARVAELEATVARVRDVAERWEGFGHGVFNIHPEESLPCSACDLIADLRAILDPPAP
jgi:hypothetical protein